MDIDPDDIIGHKSRTFTYKGHNGYILHPSYSNCNHNLIALGHTEFCAPWSDPEVHSHQKSEEYYVLLNGRLKLLVADRLITLNVGEILMLKPDVPHAVIGGEGQIEHFGIRAPALEDKRIEGKLNQQAVYKNDEMQNIKSEWGHLIPLTKPEHKNCWLIGAGSAKYQSRHMILAYLEFKTHEAANVGKDTRHQMHLHQNSWEYYLVLEGGITLQFEDEQIAVNAGEILEVPPRVNHSLHSRQAPFRGFTIRVPVELDDKIIFKD